MRADSYSAHYEESNRATFEIFEQNMQRLACMAQEPDIEEAIQRADSCFTELRDHNETFGPLQVPGDWASSQLSETETLVSAILLTLPKELWPENVARADERDLEEIVREECEPDWDFRPRKQRTLQMTRNTFIERGMDLEAIMCELCAKSECLWSNPDEESLQGTILRHSIDYLTYLEEEYTRREPTLRCLDSHCKFRTTERNEWEIHINDEHPEIAEFLAKEGVFYGSLRMKKWHGIATELAFAHGIRNIEQQTWSFQRTKFAMSCQFSNSHKEKFRQKQKSRSIIKVKFDGTEADITGESLAKLKIPTLEDIPLQFSKSAGKPAPARTPQHQKVTEKTKPSQREITIEKLEESTTRQNLDQETNVLSNIQAQLEHESNTMSKVAEHIESQTGTLSCIQDHMETQTGALSRIQNHIEQETRTIESIQRQMEEETRTLANLNRGMEELRAARATPTGLRMSAPQSAASSDNDLIQRREQSSSEPSDSESDSESDSTPPEDNIQPSIYQELAATRGEAELHRLISRWKQRPAKARCTTDMDILEIMYNSDIYITPGNMSCSVPGCNTTCRTTFERTTHMRETHNTAHDDTIVIGQLIATTLEADLHWRIEDTDAKVALCPICCFVCNDTPTYREHFRNAHKIRQDDINTYGRFWACLRAEAVAGNVPFTPIRELLADRCIQTCKICEPYYWKITPHAIQAHISQKHEAARQQGAPQAYTRKLLTCRTTLEHEEITLNTTESPESSDIEHQIDTNPNTETPHQEPQREPEAEPQPDPRNQTEQPTMDQAMLTKALRWRDKYIGRDAELPKMHQKLRRKIQPGLKDLFERCTTILQECSPTSNAENEWRAFEGAIAKSTHLLHKHCLRRVGQIRPHRGQSQERIALALKEERCMKLLQHLTELKRKSTERGAEQNRINVLEERIVDIISTLDHEIITNTLGEATAEAVHNFTIGQNDWQDSKLEWLRDYIAANSENIQ